MEKNPTLDIAKTNLRVIKRDRRNLGIKINSVRNFLEQTKSVYFTQIERELLTAQLSSMENYFTGLTDREDFYMKIVDRHKNGTRKN